MCTHFAMSMERANDLSQLALKLVTRTTNGRRRLADDKPRLILFVCICMMHQRHTYLSRHPGYKCIHTADADC